MPPILCKKYICSIGRESRNTNNFLCLSDQRVPFTVLGNVRIETVAIAVAGLLELEQFATVVELVAPPALFVEHVVARTLRL